MTNDAQPNTSNTPPQTTGYSQPVATSIPVVAISVIASEEPVAAGFSDRDRAIETQNDVKTEMLVAELSKPSSTATLFELDTNEDQQTASPALVVPETVASAYRETAALA